MNGNLTNVALPGVNSIYAPLVTGYFVTGLSDVTAVEVAHLSIKPYKHRYKYNIYIVDSDHGIYIL